MKLNRHSRNLLMSFLAFLSVCMTFSCSGLFTSLSSKANNEMGTLTLDLSGNQARNAYTYDDYVEFYKISIISETSGEEIVPALTVDSGVFSIELPDDSYSVIVQAMNSGTGNPNLDLALFKELYAMDLPLFIGRKNNVSVTTGETTAISINMYKLIEDNAIYNSIKNGTITCDGSSLETGILPTLTKDHFSFNGWFLNNTELTVLPDTSSDFNSLSVSFEYVYYTGQGIYYVSQNGTGDGSGPESPMNISQISSCTTAYKGEGNHNLPRIYLLDSLDCGNGLTLSDVEIIGIDRTNDYGPAIIRRTTGTSGTILTIASNKTCYLQNLYIDGKDSNDDPTYQGIKNSGTLTVTDCIIKNCKCVNYGGGISSESTGLLTVTGCTIDNCLSQGYYGGGICIMTGPAVLKRTTISNCSMTTSNNTYGGGVYSNGLGNLTVSHCTFYECTANNGGGLGVYNQTHNSTSTITINEDTIFDSCTTSTQGYGGGLNIYGDKLTVTMSGTSFYDCTSTLLGGGIYFYDTESTLTDCIFGIRNNGTAAPCNSIEGGAIYIFSGNNADNPNNSAELTLNHCLIDGCNATSNGGGAISMANATSLIVKNGTIIRNCTGQGTSSTTGGGAILLSSFGNISLENSKIINCSSAAKGGGICMINNNSKKATLVLSGCTISECKSKSGGGIHIQQNVEATITDCSITDCSVTGNGTSTGSGWGGALTYQDASLTLKLTDCDIKNCTSEAYGGGLYYSGLLGSTSSIELKKTSISACSAGKKNDSGEITINGKGGGIYAADYAVLTMEESSIKDCIAINQNKGGNSIISASSNVKINEYTPGSSKVIQSDVTSITVEDTFDWE